MPDWRYNVLSTSEAYLGGAGPPFDPLAASYPRRADRSRPPHTCPYTTIFLGTRAHTFQPAPTQSEPIDSYADVYSVDRSSNLTDTSSFAHYEDCRPDVDDEPQNPNENLEDTLQVKKVPYTSSVFYVAAKTELPPDVVQDNDLFLADEDSDALSSCTCDSFERCEFDCRDFEPFSDTCCCDPCDGVCTRSPKNVESPEQFCDDEDRVSTRSDMDGLDLTLFEPAQAEAKECNTDCAEEIVPAVTSALCGILFALPDSFNAETTPTAVSGTLVGVSSNWEPYYCVLQQDRRTLTAYTSEELAANNNNGEYSTRSLPRVRIDNGNNVNAGVRLRCWAAPPSITEEEAEDEVDDDAVSLRALPAQGKFLFSDGY